VLLAVERNRFRKRKPILPQHSAGGAIERKYPAIRGRDVEDAIDSNRSGLQAVFVIAGLEDPGGRELLHVGAIDLIEGAVRHRGVRAAVSRPIRAGRGVIGADRQAGKKQQETKPLKNSTNRLLTSAAQ